LQRSLAFFGTERRKFLSRQIRGRQVVEHLSDAVWNPSEPPQDAACIYIKCFPEVVPEHCWIDIVDYHQLIHWIWQHPEVGTIALSEYAKRHLEHVLPGRRVVTIPQQHCNDEGRLREDRPVRVVGFVGNGFGALGGFSPEELKQGFADVGLEFRWLFNPSGEKRFSARRDVADFFAGIDVQVSFRRFHSWDQNRKLKDALRIVNAGSFGIPTVAFPELTYEYMCRDAYIPVTRMRDLFQACKQLATDRVLYSDVALRAFELAQNYHIDKILPLYEELRCA